MGPVTVIKSVGITPATSLPATPDKTPRSNPRAGAGVQGIIADMIRGSAAGYKQTTKMAGLQADKAAIIPFETVTTATGFLKEKTANIKGVNKATGLLHTIGGFALLILTSNATRTIRNPGETAVDLGNRVADLIDGRKTAQGWNVGWGIRTDLDAEKTSVSELGSALDKAGMK